MKVTDVSKQIITGVAPIFTKHGFNVDFKSREFSREQNGCLQVFDLLFYKKKDIIEIKPILRIKVKHIEDIYHHISVDHNDIFSTLGNDLFSIVEYYDERRETGGSSGKKWIVRNQDSVDKLIEVIPEYFEETILPYFEENSSVARADELLNKHPREISIHNWLYPMRACLAIIAAKINDNPKYDELINIYEEEMEEALESYKQDFISLKKFLSEEFKSHS